MCTPNNSFHWHPLAKVSTNTYCLLCPFFIFLWNISLLSISKYMYNFPHWFLFSLLFTYGYTYMYTYCTIVCYQISLYQIILKQSLHMPCILVPSNFTCKRLGQDQCPQYVALWWKNKVSWSLFKIISMEHNILQANSLKIFCISVNSLKSYHS